MCSIPVLYVHKAENLKETDKKIAVQIKAVEIACNPT